ncbi:hypothetical protein GCK32_019292 [Trichostrongylus colubriformis]|uniref:Uncharacterized protein n=1 Tax=Trichostrongylus colubriformis TaxID=6319 RepID=A0AAN8F583_TRICO
MHSHQVSRLQYRRRSLLHHPLQSTHQLLRHPNPYLQLRMKFQKMRFT